MRERPRRLVLLGHPVAHSVSPRLHGAALHAAGIALDYQALDVPPALLDAVLRTLAGEGAGGNVTIPHKEAVAARCARLEPLAERCGAVNVFWHEEGALVGDNTDVGGAEATAALLLGDARRGARVALVGAGGAAAAVLCAMERWEGAEARVYNRHTPRARALAQRFSGVAQAVGTLEEALAGATLVVNASPIGLHDASMPVPVELLPAGAAVFDLVYRANGETAWVRAARAAGHRAADGEGMLVEQAALAFERWFGAAPDRDAMWRAMHR